LLEIQSPEAHWLVPFKMRHADLDPVNKSPI
jgi:hypothetical protein